MTWVKGQKAIHVVFAIIVVLTSIAVVAAIPELWGTNVTKFGTASGFLTVYGVIFAIVEVLRTKTVARAAQESTEKVLCKVEKLANVKLLTECQAAIDATVRCIDDGDTVPLSLLVQITKIYSQHYHEELRIDVSSQRRNTGIIESYANLRINGGRGSLKKLGNLKSTLVTMTNEINADIGRKVKIGGAI